MRGLCVALFVACAPVPQQPARVYWKVEFLGLGHLCCAPLTTGNLECRTQDGSTVLVRNPASFVVSDEQCKWGG